MMKRFILSVLITAISLGLFAQKGKVASALNYVETGSLDKAKAAIEEALVNEKTATWPKTFYARGRVAQALYESGDAKNQAMYDDILVVALNSYNKSMELDDKSSMEKLIIMQLPMLSNDFLTWAIAEFQAENYQKSLLAFEKLIEIQESEIFVGSVDTAVVYNAGLAAYNAKEYDKANEYFYRSIELKYGETSPFLLIYQGFMDREDLDNAEKVLLEAFEAFPTDQDLLLNLIQFYITNEKDQDAFAYIAKAKESDPDNFTLYWAEGALLLKQEKYDEAIAALGKSIELNPDFFATHYNMGVCYYNKASLMFDEASSIMDNAKYNAAVEVAKGVFAKAVPFFEKARALNPEDRDTLTSLKELYYRLGMTDKYDEVMARIAELEGK